MSKAGRTLVNGILKENPTFILVLGTCPTLAVTTSAINGVGMGISTMAVLICSNLVISLLRKFIPDQVRIPAYVTVIAGFVTIVQMLLKAFVPSLDQALGIYIPLIVVNCIILARAEAFASKNSAILSVMDGIGMGIGFTLALTLIGSFREVIGNGSIFGFQLFSEATFIPPMLMMILPPGGFIAYGLIMALVNKLGISKVDMKQKVDIPLGEEDGSAACAGCSACSVGAGCVTSSAEKQDAKEDEA
jgi:electron transport complex protein RnfE